MFAHHHQSNTMVSGTTMNSTMNHSNYHNDNKNNNSFYLAQKNSELAVNSNVNNPLKEVPIQEIENRGSTNCGENVPMESSDMDCTSAVNIPRKAKILAKETLIRRNS